MQQPSSPSPYFAPTAPLIPSSPHRMTLDRNRLQRASSSASGRISLVGLSNWRRRPKSNPRCTSITITNGAIPGRRKRKGLGMGMEGTPAKKRSVNNASMGTKSTPKETSSNTSINLAPFQESSSPIIPLDLLLDSADDDSSRPSRSMRGIRHITPIKRSGNEVSFETPRPLVPTSDHPDPSRRPHSTSSTITSEEVEALFSQARDLVIPLNDLSSSLPSSQGRSTMNVSGRLHEHEGKEDLTPIPSKWDLTIPLNDMTRIYGRSTEKATSSKIRQRRSPPYRISGPRTDNTLPSDQTSGGSVEIGRGLAASDRTRGLEPFLIPQKRMGDVSPHTPRQSGGQVKIGEADFSPEAERILEVPWGLGPVTGDISENRSKSLSDQSGRTGTSENAENEDPFGLVRMTRMIQDKEAQEWHASSEPSSPMVHRTPSPIAFSPSPSPRDPSMPSSVGDIGDMSTSGRNENTLRFHRGVWRGAAVMRRMEGESENEAGTEEVPSRVAKSQAPELSEEFKRARQARIQHYRDLEDDYHFVVEYVW
ncbi:hypothetical protein IAR55_001844 [Kwoniella newhampshirensis]|uniref:Uncharacterized protein n=1 Tax=Kwoniella newhampshirensis TaxID=1651941 RepID=A0AAW0Z371_9TREE